VGSRFATGIALNYQAGEFFIENVLKKRRAARLDEVTRQEVERDVRA
jgi:hypothetical protein